MTRKFKHSQGCVFVSANWIIDCRRENKLMDASAFAPVFKSAEPSKPQVSKAADTSTTIKSSQLFKGCVFCLIRVAPPADAVDFAAADLELSIRSNGGQIISHKLLDALKVDTRSNANKKRKLYAVCWGAYNASHIDLHPLVSQVTRDGLCHVVAVTPIWLCTCLSEGKVISPRHMAPILVPRKFAWQSVKPLHFSISGYSGSTRTALIHFIQAVATYDDSMIRGQTTHLIINQASGEKYEKAVEWGLHVVELEWLYHVTQYGIHGVSADSHTAKKGLGGCEANFPPLQT